MKKYLIYTLIGVALGFALAWLLIPRTIEYHSHWKDDTELVRFFKI